MIEAFEENGLGGKVKKIIGEAPFSQIFADELGADAYGHGAIDEVEKIRKSCPNEGTLSFFLT